MTNLRKWSKKTDIGTAKSQLACSINHTVCMLFSEMQEMRLHNLFHKGHGDFLISKALKFFTNFDFNNGSFKLDQTLNLKRWPLIIMRFLLYPIIVALYWTQNGFIVLNIHKYSFLHYYSYLRLLTWN